MIQPQSSIDHPDEQLQPAPTRIKGRPFVCTVILIMALAYFLVLDLLFLTWLVFSGYVAEILRSYALPEDFSGRSVLLIVTTATVLFSATVTGIILFMMKKRGGFYLFISALIIIIILDFSFFQFDWLRYLIHSGLFFLLGVLHFSRKCYKHQ